MWVVKMTNGRGHVEWFSSLAVRTQARFQEHAQKFDSQEEAEEIVRICMDKSSGPAFFSGKYWDEDQIKWSMLAVVESI